MKKCKHENSVFVETIEAHHLRIFGGEAYNYYCTNDYGNQIKVEFRCEDCKLTKRITLKNVDTLPTTIKQKIEIMQKDDNWFFT